MTIEFFNPYNFIPTPPRTGDFPVELADGEPVGHHRLVDELWSGKVTVRMKAVSPLLVPSGDYSVDNLQHKTKRTRTVGGRVAIPSSSVKGMVRSAFEAVTNSRFGEFSKHDRPLAFRQTASEGIQAFPAVVTDDGTRIRVLLGGTTPPDRANRSGFAEQGTIAAVWVLMDDLASIEARHGDFVSLDVERREHRNGFSYLGVARVGGRANIEKLRDETSFKRWGQVYMTGSTDQNRGRKYYERVFLLDEMATDLYVPLTDDIRRRWADLIADAREHHADAPAQFADYVRDAEWTTLEAGSLLYVRLRRSNAGGWEVDNAQPVAISRELHPDAPESLLDPSLRPATSLSQLSPADRVFGWIRDNAGGSRGTSYAGSVRFGEVTCVSGDALEVFDKPLTLPILGNPKPEQSRFYLGRAQKGTVVPLEDGEPKHKTRYEAGSGRALRGRKVYPNQNRQPDASSKTRDRMNQSYRDRVRAGSEFTFTLNVRNLSSVELGALLFVLDLDASLKDGVSRSLGFGGAKPLGYGSVQLTVDWSSSSLSKGGSAATAWASFDEPAADDAASCVTRFVDLVRGRAFFEAFCVATKGYRGDDRVHYPRIDPPSGKGVNEDTLKWFTQNEARDGDRRALPPLDTGRAGKLQSYPERFDRPPRGGGGPPPRRR